MLDSDRAQWVSCFVSCAAGGILEWRVGTSATSVVCGDGAGVVLCGMLLGADSPYWLIGFAEPGVMAVFLAVAALGGGIPGNVCLGLAEVIANGEGGGAEPFVVDCTNQGNDECGCCFLEAALGWD
jgi:hypothetical protein